MREDPAPARRPDKGAPVAPEARRADSLFRLPVSRRARAWSAAAPAQRSHAHRLRCEQEGFFKLPPNFRKYSKFISYGWGCAAWCACAVPLLLKPS